MQGGEKWIKKRRNEHAGKEKWSDSADPARSFQIKLLKVYQITQEMPRRNDIRISSMIIVFPFYQTEFLQEE
jgi:hypothetical protein